MRPIVSVIVPVFNCEDYVADAIKSVLDQTQDNIEVIVVDDASEDRSRSTIAQFTDERLKVVHNPENLGVSATRNRALSMAMGQWSP